MIETAKKEDLFLDPKLIKSVNKLGNLRIIDELHPVLGGQPTHEKDQPNDNNPVLDLACTTQYALDEIVKVNTKADTKLAKAQNLKDVANVSIARDNLGLGTSATLNSTSTLSDRTDQVATIKVVNDVNRAANNAQTSANNANNKANAAQTRADSAYNLANTANNNANTRLEKSKNLSDLTNTTTARNNLGLGTSATMNATSTLSDRTDQVATIKAVNDVNRDVVTAQKTANNAHALAQSKQDKLSFVGDGPDVMKTGAFGLGRTSATYIPIDTSKDVLLEKTGFFSYAGVSDIPLPERWGVAIVANRTPSSRHAILISNSAKNKLAIYEENSDTLYSFYSDQNTTTDRNGYLRVLNSKNIQKWIDVSSSRSLNATYKNNTDLMIFIALLLPTMNRNPGLLAQVLVDDLIVANFITVTAYSSWSSVTVPVPPGSTYKVVPAQKLSGYEWMELR